MSVRLRCVGATIRNVADPSPCCARVCLSCKCSCPCCVLQSLPSLKLAYFSVRDLLEQRCRATGRSDTYLCSIMSIMSSEYGVAVKLARAKFGDR